MPRVTAAEMLSSETEHSILPTYKGPSALLGAPQDFHGEITKASNQMEFRMQWNKHFAR